jgi:hypothetical protein
MRKLLIAAAVSASALAPLAVAPLAQAGGCAAGYVIGVPASDGRLPIKCVPQNKIPPGYVDSSGGNAQLPPGSSPTG